jgi:hypothetical protein
MDKSELIAIFDQDQRIDVAFPGMRRAVTPNVVRHVDASGAEEGLISYSQLSEANAAESIREQAPPGPIFRNPANLPVYGVARQSAVFASKASILLSYLCELRKPNRAR